MLLVIDTNIIVNAIKSPNPQAKSVMLLRDVFCGIHKMCISTKIIEEYEDVLKRAELQLSPQKVDRFLAWIKLNAFWIEPRPTTKDQVSMRDEDDRIFFDVAKCLNAKLVTRNYKDYPVHELITLIDEIYP